MASPVLQSHDEEPLNIVSVNHTPNPSGVPITSTTSIFSSLNTVDNLIDTRSDDAPCPLVIPSCCRGSIVRKSVQGMKKEDILTLIAYPSCSCVPSSSAQCFCNCSGNANGMLTCSAGAIEAEHLQSIEKNHHQQYEKDYSPKQAGSTTSLTERSGNIQNEKDVPSWCSPVTGILSGNDPYLMSDRQTQVGFQLHSNQELQSTKNTKRREVGSTNSQSIEIMTVLNTIPSSKQEGSHSELETGSKVTIILPADGCHIESRQDNDSLAALSLHWDNMHSPPRPSPQSPFPILFDSHPVCTKSCVHPPSMVNEKTVGNAEEGNEKVKDVRRGDAVCGTSTEETGKRCNSNNNRANSLFEGEVVAPHKEGKNVKTKLKQNRGEKEKEERLSVELATSNASSHISRSDNHTDLYSVEEVFVQLSPVSPTRKMLHHHHAPPPDSQPKESLRTEKESDMVLLVGPAGGGEDALPRPSHSDKGQSSSQPHPPPSQSLGKHHHHHRDNCHVSSKGCRPQPHSTALVEGPISSPFTPIERIQRRKFCLKPLNLEDPGTSLESSFKNDFTREGNSRRKEVELVGVQDDKLAPTGSTPTALSEVEKVRESSPFLTMSLVQDHLSSVSKLQLIEEYFHSFWLKHPAYSLAHRHPYHCHTSHYHHSCGRTTLHGSKMGVVSKRFKDFAQQKGCSHCGVQERPTTMRY